MPCSALMLPPRRDDAVVHDAVGGRACCAMKSLRRLRPPAPRRCNAGCRRRDGRRSTSRAPGNAARSAAPVVVEERRDRGDRQRDVVLDVRSFAALRFADVLAQRPQRGRPAPATARSSRRRRCRASAASRERRFDLRGERRSRSRCRRPAAARTTAWPGSGSGERRMMLARQAQREAADELEADEPVAERPLHRAQQVDGAARRRRRRRARSRACAARQRASAPPR